jgi:hypothetical protein
MGGRALAFWGVALLGTVSGKEVIGTQAYENGLNESQKDNGRGLESFISVLRRNSGLEHQEIMASQKPYIYTRCADDSDESK